MQKLRSTVIDKPLNINYTCTDLSTQLFPSPFTNEGLYCILKHTMDTKKMYLTQQGLDSLKKEHADLLNLKRPDIVARLSSAREMGDLSENAEYTAAREELAFIDGRIEELEMFLKQAV